MNKTRKRIISIFLTMSMVFTCLIGMSATALADGTVKKPEIGVMYVVGDIIDFGTDEYVVVDYYQNPPAVSTFTGQWKLSYDGIDYNVGDFRFCLTSVDDPSNSVSIYCPAPNGIGTVPDGFVFIDGDGTKENPYTNGGVYPFSVTYDANGADSGTVPVDPDKHALGTAIAVLDNTGNLVKDGKVFGGWNTAADGSGTTYSAGQTFSISKDTTLYAQWDDEANPTTVAVTGVSLNKETTTLTVGGTETLTATVRPDDATDKSVTWSSDNTNVATVDTNGLVTAVGVGTANITVTSNSDSTKNASCSVTVNPATYNVLLTGGSNATISGGSTSQSELSGAMETVTYTANSGYHFADFTDITQNGITVTKTSDSVVTVSGIPTADVNIVVPNAIAKTQISYTVTFNVANGFWNEGGSDAQTVTLTGYEGDTLTLSASQIPAVGSNPDATYKAGSWDTTPTAGMEITADTTFTYSYVKENTAPITYTNTEGEGSNYTLGTNGTLTFRFSRSENDAETINHFTGIKVDNVEVSSNNYTYSAGSVIINLKPEYLQTLSVGQHTLTAMFDDGGDVTVNFTIVAAAQNTPTPTPTPTPSGTAIASTGETFPMTVLYGIAMLIASALCIAVMSFIKPKKYKVRKVKL